MSNTKESQTREEILKDQFGDFDYKTFTSILTPETLNKILSAMKQSQKVAVDKALKAAAKEFRLQWKHDVVECYYGFQEDKVLSLRDKIISNLH